MSRAARAFFLAALASLTALPVFAAEPYGIWRRPEDGITFNFSKCGEGLCVRVRAVTDPEDKKHVGALVFSGAEKTGPATWEGRVRNLEDGQTYQGKITLTGPSTIRLDGCVLGGAICKGETWTRVK